MLTFRNQVLEMIAGGASLESTLEALCLKVEERISGACCTVTGVDPAGLLHTLAAPALPEIYRDAINGVVAGPEVGSCGAAIYLNKPVTVIDIELDPKWAGFKSLALPLGWKACSSAPVRDDHGKAIAAVALYFKDRRAPNSAEVALLMACLELCQLAMRHHQGILELKRQATIDALTGLPNRAAFDEAFSSLRCELPGSWALLLVDVDNLKATNDALGHEAGDALLKVVASRMSVALSPDTAFRIGGDEFAAILQNASYLDDMDETAGVVLEALKRPVECEGTQVTPRATIGGAVLTPLDTSPETVRRNADYALYHAKETARGSFVRYWPGIGSRIAQRRDSVRDVADALHDHRIDAHYQPIVRLDTGELVGFEALCRMVSIEGQLVPAARFQDAFDDARIAGDVTERMLSIVAGDIRSWLNAGLPIQHVGINVSSADFYKGNLLAKFQRAFGEWNVPLKHLVVEVTENAYLGQRDRVVATGIAELRRERVRVALDDFGTGFASLTHLLTVPVDVIKIDQSFVRALASGHASVAVVKGIVQIATDLGIKVVAEGIETQAQSNILRSLQCVLGQGYAYSRPVDRVQAQLLLMKHGQGIPGAQPVQLFDESSPKRMVVG